MIGQLTKFFIFLFPILVTDQAGSNAVPHSAAIATHTAVGNSALSASNAPALYPPGDVGMDAMTLARIDRIVKEGMRARAFPGCQVMVMKDGKPVYEKCFGRYAYESAQEVKPTTLYDLASLSKTTGTLLAVMKLYDTGKLKLTDKASAYLPFLRGTDKENITITELLFHESGLPAALPFYNLVIESKHTASASAPSNKTAHKKRRRRRRIVHVSYQFKEGWVSHTPSAEFPLQLSDSVYINRRFHDAAMQMIADAHLYGKTYNYSDLNFILLKEIAETISGIPMEVFLEKEFYAPLGLRDMGYLPLRTHKKNDIAPTLKDVRLRNGVVQGYVHDPSAAFLGGVSGNAGLFASARDVATVYQMILNGGEMNGRRFLSTETCRLFTTTTSPSGRRGLGYDKPVPSHPKTNPCSMSAPQEVFGHTGYTGTCCWVDPVNKLVFVFLSNRTYPADSGNKLSRLRIRPKIQDVIYESMK